MVGHLIAVCTVVGENILELFLAVRTVVGTNILEVFLAVRTMVGENILEVFLAVTGSGAEATGASVEATGVGRTREPAGSDIDLVRTETTKEKSRRIVGFVWYVLFD